MLKKILTLTLFLGLAACSSSKDGKKANSLADEHNRLGAWLTDTRPDATWTYAELDAYKMKIERYAETERQLRQMDGHGGISVRGGNNEGFILGKRLQLDQARYQKDHPNDEYDTARPRPYRRHSELESDATVQDTALTVDESNIQGSGAGAGDADLTGGDQLDSL